MKILRIGLIAVFTLFVSISTFAQTPDTEPKEETEKPRIDSPIKQKDGTPKATREANEAFEAKEYFRATELLKKAISKTKGGRDAKADLNFKLGECFRHISQPKEAEKYYGKAVKLGYKDPIAQFYVAEAVKAQGDYEDAIIEYQEYLKLVPGDKKAEIAIETCKMAKSWIDNPSTRYIVNNMKDLNSEATDFAPSYAGKAREHNVLYFTSKREGSTGNQDEDHVGESFSDIYVSNQERKEGGRRGGKRNKDKGPQDPQANAKWSEPVPITEMVNTKHHEATSTFDSRRKTMYFTYCEKERNTTNSCKIMMSEKRGLDWGAPVVVYELEDSTKAVGHPSLSPDDNVLYFASNMDGGYGGRDLWSVTYDRREKKWGNPKNLGPKINTEGNELFPFAHNDGYFYFASDGLPGMGGLDIFRAEMLEDGTLGEPENMQYPINSSQDDFSIVFEDGDSRAGFMASNRDGGQGGDDIYSVFLQPLLFVIQGVVTDNDNGEELDGVTVTLTGGIEPVTVITDGSGYYVIDAEDLEEDVTYKLEYSKDKYVSGSATASTVGIPMSDFELTKEGFLHTITVDVGIQPKEIPFVLPKVEYEFGDSALTEVGKKGLDSLVSIMNLHPNYTILLRSHTDHIGGDAANLKLSKGRARSCIEYLVTQGVARDRMEFQGMGETEPYVIPKTYDGAGSDKVRAGDVLTERFIKSKGEYKSEIDEALRQLNRRTDFKILSEDYVPREPTEAEKQQEEKEAKPLPVVYVLGRGERFTSLARKYDISPRDIKKLNGFKREREFEGMEVKVTKDGDYKSYDASHYRVGVREDFKSIAKKLGMEEDALKDLNPGLKDKDLVLGMSLVTDEYTGEGDDYVYAGNVVFEDEEGNIVEDEVIDEVGGEEVTTNDGPEGEIYVVEGDRPSWGTIAKATGLNIRDIKQLNGGLTGVRPFPGLELKVTRDGNYAEYDRTHHRVERGETSFKTIGKKIDVDDKVLEDLNPGLKDKDLKPGVVIIIAQ